MMPEINGADNQNNGLSPETPSEEISPDDAT
jgi:hypothetical protein